MITMLPEEHDATKKAALREVAAASSTAPGLKESEKSVIGHRKRGPLRRRAKGPKGGREKAASKNGNLTGATREIPKAKESANTIIIMGPASGATDGVIPGTPTDNNRMRAFPPVQTAEEGPRRVKKWDLWR